VALASEFVESSRAHANGQRQDALGGFGSGRPEKFAHTRWYGENVANLEASMKP